MSSRNLWRLLTVAAILFAGGISGSWLNRQFDPTLATLRWGWFGAIIAGCAVFGGVILYVQGERRQGALIILVGAVADVTLSFNYFGESHTTTTALVLGFYPTLVAILGGVVEATHQRTERRAEEETQRLSWELEQAARQQEWERQQAAEEAEAKRIERLRRLELNADLTRKIRLAEIESANVRELPRPAAESPRSSPESARNSLNDEERSALDAIRRGTDGGSFASSAAVELSPWSKTKTYELLAAADAAGMIRKVGHGQWAWKEHRATP